MCRTTIYQIHCADCNGFMREHKSREYCQQIDQYYSNGYRSGQQWPSPSPTTASLGGSESSASWPDGYGKCATGEMTNTFTDANTQRCFACKRKRDERALGESLGSGKGRNIMVRRLSL
ncbi:hypothetical protein B0T09DRAFT_352160 [Sordaria sp. MPI-SDFR-AT-0083]|nr:hypothetical protein B0T09DRAFT_352160 [Sordaria sp. MPI-SDFR-AT-0083]